MEKRFAFIAITVLLGLALPGSLPSVYAQESGLINVNPDPDGEPWIAGGITEQEWEQMTADLPTLEQILPQGLSKVAAGPTPTRVDNTLLPAFRPIFSQKGGSCAMASSIGYVFTYEINTLRKLPANVLENQYPYDFTYNFCNSGSGSNGSMPTQGFEIAQLCGIPDAKTYGGFGLGVHNQWISGYDKYFAGMANRALNKFTIKVNTVAGITQMRQWFNDHGTGTENGGCMVFCYNSSGSTTISLAAGTPEAGKKALVKFGTSGGHAVSIAGYDDSVRYDYNGDGKYTNDVDINSDGVVNIKDWEIGAMYMVNSWGTSFGNSGKIYVPYKLCADVGGLWSNLVYGMRVDQAVTKPRFTYKVSMSHTNRSLIRIRAGYANNGTATAATGTPVTFGKAFNYAGGVYPMQGINSNPIEIGLDVSRFAPSLTASTVTFFLLIDSRGGTGTVQSFSLMDYTNASSPVETACSQQNVTIPAGTTSAIKTLTLKIVKSIGQVNVTAYNGNLFVTPRINRSGTTLSFANAGSTIRIFAMNGSLIAERTIGSSGTFDVSALPTGVYLAKTGKAMLKFVR
ncbi:MAG: T9SS type A sorting domain-containing protein [Chitinispirillaceae bacterium]|nr:T9SS type A sorting domain-containing protein [Chitinispirillaceae bacterium]